MITIRPFRPSHQSFSRGRFKFYLRKLSEDITVTAFDHTFKVPKGYKTDLATVPRILWFLFPPFGADEVAFIVHDYMYEYKKELPYTKRQMDYIMRIVQSYTGANFIRRWFMWLAVALFGFLYY